METDQGCTDNENYVGKETLQCKHCKSGTVKEKLSTLLQRGQ